MQLPLPTDDDAYRTTDGGRIVFLTPYGCTVRVIKKQYHFSLEHPNCLRPLFKRAAGDFMIEINPGMEMSAENRDVPNLLRRLNAAGVQYDDCGRNNVGYVPGSNRGFPVIIDLPGASLPWAYYELKHSVAAMKKILERGDPQKDLYGDLYASFREAWPEDREKPGASLVRRNWQACLDLKRKGLLRSDWEGNTYREIGALSQSYADKLQLHRAAGFIP
jgi:hypothetical protein